MPVASIARAMNVATTGLHAQEMNLNVAAGNLAAQGVDGYKSKYLVLTTLPAEDAGHVGAQASAAGDLVPAGLQLGLGVKSAAIDRSFAQGSLEATGEAFDIAISGEGFIAVNMPSTNTTAYTRISSFAKDAQGNLQTINGYQIVPNITIPANAQGIKISEDGQVQVEIQGQINSQVLGTITLTTFLNPKGLRELSDGLFEETAASGNPIVGNPNSDNRGSLKQGFRESSNVNAVKEVTDLIKTEKIFQMLTKVVNAGDSMYEAQNKMGRG